MPSDSKTLKILKPIHSYDNLNNIKSIDNLQILNDVWTSDDGLNWNEITGVNINKFSPRCNFKIIHLLHDDSLILVGGMNEDHEELNDVWKSSDGINWYLLTPNAEFKPRSYFTLN